MPPAAASADPSAKVKEMIRSLLIPTSEAATGLNDSARMAVPMRVCSTMWRRANSSTSATTNTRICALDITTPAQVELMHRKQRRKRPRIGAEYALPQVLQQQRHTNGGDQHGERRAPAQRPVGQLLDDNAEQRADRHRAQQHTAMPAAVEPPGSTRARK